MEIVEKLFRSCFIGFITFALIFAMAYIFTVLGLFLNGVPIDYLVVFYATVDNIKIPISGGIVTTVVACLSFFNRRVN